MKFPRMAFISALPFNIKIFRVCRTCNDTVDYFDAQVKVNEELKWPHGSETRLVIPSSN